jgi:arginase
MARILVPYHLDERLDDLDVPLAPADAVVTADLADGDPWSRMARLYDVVGDRVAATTRGGARPIVVSGDCTTSLGTMAGLRRAGLDPAIVWYDAHGDVQTLETTQTGYLGGLPLRILIGYRPELVAARLGLRPVAEECVVLVDARDLDPPEATYLERAAIRRADVVDLDADRLPDGPIYLHLDLDVVNPDQLPGLRFPAPGGFGWLPMVDSIRRVLDTGRVVAVGIGCTWHPGRGAGERASAELAGVLGAWE